MWRIGQFTSAVAIETDGGTAGGRRHVHRRRPCAPPDRGGSAPQRHGRPPAAMWTAHMQKAEPRHPRFEVTDNHCQAEELFAVVGAQQGGAGLGNGATPLDESADTVVAVAFRIPLWNVDIDLPADQFVVLNRIQHVDVL